MSKINAINNTTGSLTIDPGVTGDSFLQLDINATSEFRIGIDDDASDSFKISQGSALGANDTFIMTDAGERTMPLQPCFLARLNAVASNVTGNGDSWTVVADNEIFDNNSDFASNTFTAPQDGRYYLRLIVASRNAQAANSASVLTIVTSNRTYQLGRINQFPIVAAGEGDYTFNSGVLVDMDASDTTYGVLAVYNGNKVIDINTAADMRTMFCGYLVC